MSAEDAGGQGYAKEDSSVQIAVNVYSISLLCMATAGDTMLCIALTVERHQRISRRSDTLLKAALLHELDRVPYPATGLIRSNFGPQYFTLIDNSPFARGSDY